MVNREDEFWERLLRCTQGEPTPAELEAEIDCIKPIPLDDALKASIIRRALGKGPIEPKRRTTPNLDCLGDDVHANKEAAEPEAVLNRNCGEEDDALREQLEKLREDALKDNDDTDTDDELP